MRARDLERCLNIADLRNAARRRAHRLVFDYIDGGAEDERTLTRNRVAFTEYELLYRVLVGWMQSILRRRSWDRRSPVLFLPPPPPAIVFFMPQVSRPWPRRLE